jgi:hypothetical protein
MSNPWLKKNPFMSLWLSAANRFAGSFRGHAAALGKQQGNAAMAEARSPAAPKAKAGRKR